MHAHHDDETCYDAQLYAYHLTCHTWRSLVTADNGTHSSMPIVTPGSASSLLTTVHTALCLSSHLSHLAQPRHCRQWYTQLYAYHLTCHTWRSLVTADNGTHSSMPIISPVTPGAFVSAAVAVDSSHFSHHHLLRGVDSVHLQILLIDTCRQCCSWSVAGHSHKKVIGRDPIYAS